MLFLNMTLAMMLLCTTNHVLIFYLLYEVTTFIILPMLTSSSRSVRKGFALTTLYMVMVLGLLAYLAVLTVDILEVTCATSYDWSRSNLLMAALLVMILTKTPTYPVLFWLPEAHVESTWIGSSMLACMVLKYSMFACLMFSMSSSAHTLISLQWYLAGLSLAWCTLAILPHADLKSMGAFLSILHMNAAVVSLMVSGFSTSLSLTDLWLAHSILALMWFYWVGMCYSSSGARTIMTANSPDQVLMQGLASFLMVVSMVFYPYGPLSTQEYELASHLAWEVSVPTFLAAHYYLVSLPVFLMGLLLVLTSGNDLKALSLDLPLSFILDVLFVCCWYGFPWPW